MPHALSFYWFDVPDGEGIVEKTNFAAKLGLIVSTPFAAYDAIFNPQKNLRIHAFRYAAIVIPAMGLAATFAISSQMICKHVPEKTLSRAQCYAAAGFVTAGALACLHSTSSIKAPPFFFFPLIAGLSRTLHEREQSVFLDDIVNTPINDRIFGDYRNAGPLSLPPPAARPARTGSMITS